MPKSLTADKSISKNNAGSNRINSASIKSSYLIIYLGNLPGLSSNNNMQTSMAAAAASATRQLKSAPKSSSSVLPGVAKVSLGNINAKETSSSKVSNPRPQSLPSRSRRSTFSSKSNSYAALLTPSLPKVKSPETAVVSAPISDAPTPISQTPSKANVKEKTLDISPPRAVEIKDSKPWRQGMANINMSRHPIVERI